MDPSPTGLPTEFASQEENVNLRQYWHIILERRWLVIVAFISVFILTLLYLVKAPRIFQAAARLQIDRESENILGPRENLVLDRQEQDYLQTQYKNLKSRSLIQTVVNQLKLDQDSRYAKASDILKKVDDDIAVVPIRLSRLVDVKVEHTDPNKAQAIANTLLDNFIQKNLDNKKESYSAMFRWLQQETEVQRSRVEEADKQLQQYKNQLQKVSLEETQNIVLQRLRLAQEKLVNAQSKDTLANRINTEVQDMLKKGASIESMPAVAQDRVVQGLKEQLILLEAELAGLRTRYKDKHPEMIKMRMRVEALRQSWETSMLKVVDAINTEALISRSERDSITGMVKTLEDEQLKLGEISIKYDALKRDAELHKSLFLKLLERQKETEITANSSIKNMVVVDKAMIPLKFYKPRIGLVLVLGVIGGLLVACGLAFFVNYLDDSIKTQDDVEIYLRAPFLGYIPNIKSNSVIERDLQAHMHPQSTAAEGFRSVRAAIALMPKADQFRLLVVTSTIPSEGKSLLASNLAIVTAQTGLKTLLVDTDLRRPSVHKAYQLHSPVGLSAYLNGSVSSVDEIVHTTEVANLEVVCAGATPSNPSEMAGSIRMRQFLQEASRRYDRIFLDSPPVSAVSDPLVTSSMADGVIFVTKFNKIRREHARKSLQRLQSAGIHVLGVVLNDIDFEGKDAYYYSYYYYQNRYYSSHYKTDGKVAPAAKSEKGEKAATV